MDPRNKSEGDGFRFSFAGMTRKSAGMTKVMVLAAFVALTLAACGRKDVPAYPPDAIENPGTLPRTRDQIRYY